MYNPGRVKGANHVNRYNPPPSSVKSRHTVPKTALSLPVGERNNTQHGYSVTLFEGKGFVNRYEIMYAGHNTGLRVNDKADRTVFIVRGNLYVGLVNAQGNTDTQKHMYGNTIKLPAGTKYYLATDGNEGVELLITEDPDYDKVSKQLGAAVVGSVPVIGEAVPREPIKRVSVEELRNRAAKADTNQAAPPRRKPGRPPGTGKRLNDQASTVLGVSPMPSGPPREE